MLLAWKSLMFDMVSLVDLAWFDAIKLRAVSIVKSTAWP